MMQPGAVRRYCLINIEAEKEKIMRAYGKSLFESIFMARFAKHRLTDHLLPARIIQRSAVSGQRSAVSGQRSAVSGQRSAVSGQRSAVMNCVRWLTSAARSAFSDPARSLSKPEPRPVFDRLFGLALLVGMLGLLVATPAKAQPALTSLTFHDGAGEDANAYTLTPTFNSATRSYSITVPHGIRSFWVTAEWNGACSSCQLGFTRTGTSTSTVDTLDNMQSGSRGRVALNSAFSIGQRNYLTFSGFYRDEGNAFRSFHRYWIRLDFPVPTNLAPTPGNGKLDLSWTATTGGTGYDVHYTFSDTVADDAAASGADPATAWVDAGHTGTTTTQAITGLTNGTAYRVRVRSTNSANKDFGAWVHATGTPQAPPAAPTGLSARPGAARLDLSWTVPSGQVTGYDVQYKTAAAADETATTADDPSTGWVDAGHTGTTAAQAITGLTGGTAYQVRVRAKNNGGPSAWSAPPVEGTPQAPAPAPAAPDEPSNLTPSFGGAEIPDQSWTEGKQVETLTLPAATGGDGDLAYSLTPALPSGVTFDATTRQVTGTPETPQEAVTYTYSATDTDGDTDELSFTITVEENLIPSFGDAAIPDQSWTEGRAIAELRLPVATGGNGDLAYSLTPAVPVGLTLAAATRMLSGTPTRAQAARGYTWTVTDADGDTDTVSFTITVEAALAQEVQAWLTRFGRTVGQQAVDAIEARRSAARTPGFSGTFAGQALPTVAGSGDDETREAGDGPAMQPEIGHRPVIDRLRDWLSGDREAGQVTQSTTTALGMEQVLAGTAFALTQDTDNGASLGLWGAGAHAGFSGREGGLSVEGDVSSFMLGTDWARDDHLLGLMLAHSRGSGSYSSSDGAGGIESRLTSLVPYANWDVSERVSVWGAVGLGRGDMTLRPEDGAVLGTDIDWRMAAAGADGSLGHVAALGGADLRWTADALWTRTTSEARAGLAAVSGDTTRLRFGVETGWTRVLSSGAVLSPRLEMAARHDGGDAETGFGVEIGGGLDWFDPVRGLEVGVTGRRLVLHEQDGFEDWGVALTMSYDPTPDTKRGFSAGVSRSLGGASSGGMAALLGPQTFPTATGSEAGGTWSAEMAYGVSRGRGMVASPYTRLSGGGGAEQARLGYRVEPDAAHAADMNLDLWLQPGTANTGETAGGGLNWRW